MLCISWEEYRHGVPVRDGYGWDSMWGIRIWIFLGEAQMEYNIIFPRIFNDIPFNTISYSMLRLNRNTISYFSLRSPYSSRRVGTGSQSVRLCAVRALRCLRSTLHAFITVPET